MAAGFVKQPRGARVRRLFDWYVSVAERRTGLLLVLFLALGVVALTLALKLELHTDMAELLPDNHPAVQAFRRIGLVPDGSATYHLPRMIGRARAMEMMLLGEKIPAKTALEWGLVNRCVPDAELLTTAKALAKELANGPAALGMIRRLAWASLDNSWAEQLQAERATQRKAGLSDDFREGVQAFFQKRPAVFKGA